MPYHKIDRVALLDIKGDGVLSEAEKKMITRTWKKKRGLLKRIVDWTRGRFNG